MVPLVRLHSHLWLAAFAFAGLVAGHWISYLVVAPDAHARRELLESTGHRSHDLFVTLGLAAALAGMIAVIAGRLRETPTGHRAPARVLRSARSLWLLQTAGFVALEAVERVHTLHEVSTLLQEPAFLLGLVAQVLVAVVAAGIVFLLRRTVDAIRRLLSLPTQPGPRLQLPLPQDPSFHQSVARAAWNLRGPPIAAQIQG